MNKLKNNVSKTLGNKLGQTGWGDYVYKVVCLRQVIQHEIVVREGETARIPCDLSYSLKNRV